MVQFGTSGWRGIIGRELTFRRVRMVVQAILETLREEEKPVERIVIGFDTRMLSEKFAVTTAQLLASNGVAAELTPRVVPDPQRAVREAAEGLGPEDLLCAAGSVYLAGIARRVLLRDAV